MAETQAPSVDQYEVMTPSPDWHVMTFSELVKVVVSGAIAGLVTMAIYYMLEKYIVEQLLCQSGSACTSRTTAASAIAMIVVAIGLLFFLIKERIYRPLLIVLVVTLLLWGVPVQLAAFSWWAVILLSMVLFGAAYGLCAWISQLRNLLIAVGLLLVIVIASRLLISF